MFSQVHDNAKKFPLGYSSFLSYFSFLIRIHFLNDIEYEMPKIEMGWLLAGFKLKYHLQSTFFTALLSHWIDLSCVSKPAYRVLQNIKIGIFYRTLWELCSFSDIDLNTKKDCVIHLLFLILKFCSCKNAHDACILWKFVNSENKVIFFPILFALHPTKIICAGS